MYLVNVWRKVRMKQRLGNFCGFRVSEQLIKATKILPMKIFIMWLYSLENFILKIKCWIYLGNSWKFHSLKNFHYIIYIIVNCKSTLFAVTIICYELTWYSISSYVSKYNTDLKEIIPIMLFLLHARTHVTLYTCRTENFPLPVKEMHMFTTPPIKGH